MTATRGNRRFGSATMRLLDLGTVPWIRSQSVHHAIAHTFGEETPDTFVIVRPDRPYVCLGRHAVGVPVSRAAAARLGMPIVRRQLGGGAVLITPEQTFFVLVAGQKRLPLPDRSAYAWALAAGAAAYRRLGIDAQVGPGNDLTAGGRKLCGSGAASIGAAAVVGGNVIHDFDAAQFLDLVETPSPALRSALFDEMQTQMGSVRLLTGRHPAPSDVAGALIRGAEEAYGVSLISGSLTDVEQAAIPATETWLRRIPAAPDASRPPYWKVRSGSGVLRLTLEDGQWRPLIVLVREHKIASVFAEQPADAPMADALGSVLRDRRVDDLSPVESIEAAAVPGDVAAELAGWLRRLERWVT